MFVAEGRRLDAGDPFPEFTVALPGGADLHLPGGPDQPFLAVLIFRGAWCPYCRTQLTSFQTGIARLEATGVGLVAASADTETATAEMVEALGLTFPVGYGLAVPETARLLGTYYDAGTATRAPYLQSSGFVLGPDRRVLLTVASSGAIGRLAWQDVVGMVDYARRSGAA